MKRFDFFKRPLMIILAVAIMISTGAWVYAKYIYQETLKGSITISANLGDISVWEHEAIQQADGSYQLSNSVARKYNSYMLIPGLDVPKDPYVKITNKTNVPAYVFVEVVANFTPSDSGINFFLTDKWKKLNGVTGPKGGTVYYYNTILNGSLSSLSIQILKELDESPGCHIRVSQELKGVTYLSGSDSADFYPNGQLQLDFYAYMGQAIDGNTPMQVFQTIFSNQSN